MERPKLTYSLASLVAVVALAGCGLQDPYQPSHPRQRSRLHMAHTSTATSTTTTVADAGDPPPERGGTIPGATRAAEDRISPAAASATPRAAVDRYALLYINWQAGHLAATQRKLARISIGAARLQAQQAAANAVTNTQLHANQVANHGQIVSTYPGVGPAAGKWVIVTSEKTTGTGDYTGLPAAIHVTYAVVIHTPDGWVISQWTPQN